MPRKTPHSGFVSQREELKSPIREFVHDPVHGPIRLEPHEKLFLDTPIFQRLRRVKQLQTAHFVYPGANHTRFEHTLGVFHIASYFADNVLEQLVDSGTLKHTEKLHYKRLVRLWALFHDVGHGPFSHTFDTAVMSKIGMNHEKLSIRIIKENDEIHKGFSSKEFKATGISIRDVIKAQEDSLSKFNPIEKALLQIIKGPYSADTTDYLLRDSYHTGVEYGRVAWQRLILTSRILGDKMCLEKRSKAALISFFFARHQMFDTVYYHRTNSAADRMIRDILERASDTILPYVEDLNKYVDLDEESLLQMLKNSSDKTTSQMTRDYMNRKIPWRLAYEEQKPINESLLIELLRSEQYQKAIQQKIERKVSKDLNFYVTGFYIPETPLNPFRNIAEVDIYNHDTDSVESWNFIHDLYMHSPFHTWLRVYIDKKYGQKDKAALVRAAKDVFSGSVAEVHM
jgi:HD superfamily phosphohydrolase